MKTYTIQRTSGVHATVSEDGTQYALPHLVRHSPDGFEFGFGGSGPSDLARSIIGDLMGTETPSPRIYQEFKFQWLAPLEGDGPFRFGESDIREWIDSLGKLDSAEISD